MENNNLHLKCFNRFANYLSQHIDIFVVKIENDNVMFCDRRFNSIYSNVDLYDRWVVSTEKVPLKTQIEMFFFGKNMESIEKYRDYMLMSIFEFMDLQCTNIFGNPSCFEELVIKMDLMGI